jgi:hypothetical protein
MANKTNKVAGKPGLDPTLPDVELVLGGETFALAYDFNAVCQAEKATGINLLSSVVGEITASSLRGLLWASVLKDRPDITIDEVGALIRPTNIATIREAVVSCWFGSVPDVEPGEGKGQSE